MTRSIAIATSPTRNYLSSMLALLERERMVLVGDSFGLAFLAALLEPVFHIAVVVLWHWAIRIMPVYGTSKVLFISSGMYPLFVFIHLSHGLSALTKTDGALRRFPRAMLADVVVIRAFIKLTMFMGVGIILFGAMSVFITPQALPFDSLSVVLAMAALSCMGIGAGMFNAAISPILPFWHYIWGPLSRSLILFGGVLYVPDFLPQNMRDWLMWNPVMQGVELFRQGFYPSYPKTIYMPNLLFGGALCSMAIGIIALRMLQRRLDRE